MASSNVDFWHKFLRKGLQDGDPVAYGVIVALVIGIITLLLFLLKQRKNNRRGVLIVGLCDSGKTLLYSRLVEDRYVETYTSMKENSGTYKLQGEKTGSTLQLVDLPGHERLRGQFLDDLKTSARAIIFVVDSLSFQKEIKDVAEYIYSILTDGWISSNIRYVLILCNKQDFTLAKGAKVIQSQLEKEMNTLRVTRSAALIGTDSSGNNNTYLGKRNKPFEFSDCRPFKIEFAESSAKDEDGKANIKEVVDWLHKVA